MISRFTLVVSGKVGIFSCSFIESGTGQWNGWTVSYSYPTGNSSRWTLLPSAETEPLALQYLSNCTSNCGVPLCSTKGGRSKRVASSERRRFFFVFSHGIHRSITHWRRSLPKRISIIGNHQNPPVWLKAGAPTIVRGSRGSLLEPLKWLCSEHEIWLWPSTMVDNKQQ